jgi:hypothetical protein
MAKKIARKLCFPFNFGSGNLERCDEHSYFPTKQHGIKMVRCAGNNTTKEKST